MKALWRAFWRWFERDINDTRPLSPYLGLVAMGPGFVLLELGFDHDASWLVVLLGLLLAIIWAGYAIYRRITRIVRDVRRTWSDSEAHKRGEEVTTRCPECGEDLPEWDPPDDRHSYDFRGWICENCETMVDQYGHRV